jgi:hypothetical protein
MKEKLQSLSDAELIQLAHELTQTTLPADAIARKIVGEGDYWVLKIIELTAELTQALAERLKCCSPHIEK